MKPAILSNQPYKIIIWEDTEDTGAKGWIVIHNLANGISGGGLFMHESATLHEVKDLAYTMSLKNSLQSTIIGGGKAGIKFDANDFRAPAVLKRFLKDNIDIIESEWCTGGDINTTTKEIAETLAEISHLKSPFHCLANLIEKKFNQSIDITNFNNNLLSYENKFFTVDQAITGFSVFKTIETKVKMSKPKIIVQGFGKVGRAFCFYASQYYNIVGICEQNWFICDSNGIDIEKLLLADIHQNPQTLNEYNPIFRQSTTSNENFLIDFLKQTHANIFCPCANRYCITEQVLNTLIAYTFIDCLPTEAFIIAGANDVFEEKYLVNFAFRNNITVIPEWLSNLGSAILFMEALSYNGLDNYWNSFIKQEITDRIQYFSFEAANIANQYNLNIYDACCHLAKMTIKKFDICDLNTYSKLTHSNLVDSNQIAL